MYTEHEMEVLDFDSRDVFAAIGDEASDEGSGSYSWKPDRSDSQEIFAMYEKHQMGTILFEDGNVYTGLVLSGDDGNTGGTYSWGPDRSDSQKEVAMYEKYEMSIVTFEESCVFADLGVSGDESGGIVVHSVNPDSSDK